MDTNTFAKDVETLFYALKGDSRLKDTPIHAGEIAPTDAEQKAYLFRLGAQQFVVALDSDGIPYWTNNLN